MGLECSSVFLLLEDRCARSSASSRFSARWADELAGKCTARGSFTAYCTPRYPHQDSSGHMLPACCCRRDRFVMHVRNDAASTSAASANNWYGGSCSLHRAAMHVKAEGVKRPAVKQRGSGPLHAGLLLVCRWGLPFAAGGGKACSCAPLASQALVALLAAAHDYAGMMPVSTRLSRRALIYRSVVAGLWCLREELRDGQHACILWKGCGTSRAPRAQVRARMEWCGRGVV